MWASIVPIAVTTIPAKIIQNNTDIFTIFVEKFINNFELFMFIKLFNKMLRAIIIKIIPPKKALPPSWPKGENDNT